MPIWVWTFIILTGLLFGLKMTYVLCTALVVPVTQGALYVSTSRSKIASFIEAVPMEPGQVLVDLGCGDGRVLRKARKSYGVRAIGYEVNILAYLKAQVLSIGCRDVEIKYKNFWSADLSEADVVFCYLYPDVMRRLARKLKTDLRPGTLIVSANFDIPGFELDRLLHSAGSAHRDPLYVYQV